MDVIRRNNMTIQKKWLYLAVGGVGALALAAAVLFVLASPAMAEARSVLSPEWPGGGDNGYDEALANALGISIEELQAAYESARAAAIQQAVDEGRLTQEQADQLLSGEAPEPRDRSGMDELVAGALGVTVEQLQAAYESARAEAMQQAAEEGHLTQEQAGRRPNGGEGPGGQRAGFDFHGSPGVTNELLADALGITTEELQAAQEQAFSAVIAQAVEDGTITQEEADLMQAHSAIRGYVGAAMSDAYANAVQQALADGVITQAQADQLLSEEHPGFPGSGGFFGGHGGPGMHGGFGPCRPDGE
jgi:polyhydroxyalkanoate synthesis regulator phasin